jgi:phosphate transport system substrate-binding protein
MKCSHFLAALATSALLAGTGVAFAATNITIAGSTALLPLAKDAADAYQAANKDVNISVSGGGSGTGINQVAAKAIDIGMSDVPAPVDKNLTDNKVAVVTFAVIAHPGVGVKGLTKSQIQSIFSGKVTNWKDVGGADQKIVVANRVKGSGTRATFENVMMSPVKVAEGAISQDATGTVVSFVKQTPGAVSYASLSGIRAGSGVLTLAIDGADPTPANVVSGKYPFWSYEHMLTNGPASGEVKKFIDFVTSHNDLLKKNQFIPIADMKVTKTDR